jgi:hypothetical protein
MDLFLTQIQKLFTIIFCRASAQDYLLKSYFGVWFKVNLSSVNSKDDLKKLPLPGEPVWVQCDGFRCLASLDKKGR